MKQLEAHENEQEATSLEANFNSKYSTWSFDTDWPIG